MLITSMLHKRYASVKCLQFYRSVIAFIVKNENEYFKERKPNLTTRIQGLPILKSTTLPHPKADFCCAFAIFT